MTALQRLYTEYGQSPWLDNLTRGYLRDGTLKQMVADGIRGVTANPTIFAKSVLGSTDYDGQFAALTAAGVPLEDAYWQLVVDDTTAALAVLGVETLQGGHRSAFRLEGVVKGAGQIRCALPAGLGRVCRPNGQPP